MHEHIISYDFPGSTWNSGSKELLIKSHLALGSNLFSQNHYHLYIKYAYAKAFIEKDSSLLFWTNLYNKMQQKRIGFTNIQGFNELINSILEVGFLKEFPIPIDNGQDILDGSHRLAIAHACKLDPVVEVYRNSSHSYNRIWFESVGFTKAELDRVDIVSKCIPSCTIKSYIQPKVVIIWGSAFEFWEQIFSILKQKNVVFTRWINFEDPDFMKSFVIETYEGDGMKMDNIHNKALKLSGLTTLAAIVVLDHIKDEEGLRKIKTDIRNKISPQMKNYFFDSIIHIIDSSETSNSILKKYVPL
jgi:(2Fe-2S) ferredoxin